MSIENIILYFPDTGGANFTPPYEILEQHQTIKSLPINIILIDARTCNIDEILPKYNGTNALLIISTLINYTSVTIAHQFEDGLITSEKAHQKFNIKSIWTGQAAFLMKHRIEKLPYVDAVIDKINETCFFEYLSTKLNQKKATTSESNEKEHKKNANDILSLIDFTPYIHNNTLDYIASTGCINSCTFCSVPSIYKQKWSPIDYPIITQHLLYIKENYPDVKYIHFRDDNFAVKKNHVFALLDNLKKQQINFGWSAQTSVNILKTYTDEDLKKLRDAGCNNISIGIESGDEWILKKVTHNKTNLHESQLIIKRLLKSGIEPSITSIIGFPDNKGRDFELTLKTLMKIKLIHPSLSLYCTVFQPIPTTEAFKEIFGDDYHSENILLNNTWTNKKQKDVLKKFEMLYFTFCDKNFHKRLPHSVGKKIKIYNIILYPLIRLRFKLGLTRFLWEYAIWGSIIAKHLTKSNSANNDLGIRRHNTNYQFGFHSQNEKNKD